MIDAHSAPRVGGPGACETALRELLNAADAIATAVETHDRGALEVANALADRLANEIGSLTSRLNPDEAASLSDPDSRFRQIVERLRAAGRRNGLLIERAWALDAATTRLLAGLARAAAEGAPLYAPTSIVAVERRA